MSNIISEVLQHGGDIIEQGVETVVDYYMAPTEIIIHVAQGQSLEEAAKNQLTDFQRNLMDTRASLAPITDPTLAVAGKAWESEVGLATRKIVFNKYTDFGYQIGVQNRILSNIPVYQKCYNKVDEYTGNYLTRIENAATVPGRLGRGEPVTTAELISAAIIAAQIAAIVFSGGSAAACIGLMASQLKQGPLGATEEGRILLTLAEVGAYAYGGAGGAGSAGTSAGTAVAQQTTTEVVTRAVAQKAQQMAAEKAAEKIAEKTDIGIVGQLALSGTLGGGTYAEVLKKEAEKQAMQEAQKQVGPELMLIGAAVISASITADATGQTFTQVLMTELEKKVKIEAIHYAEAEIRKQLGEPAASIAIAAMKGEKIEDIAKKQLTEQERKVLEQQLGANAKYINQLNLQKQAELLKIANGTPEQRTAALNNAASIDQQILKAESAKNYSLQNLGFCPLSEQKQLTENAAVAQVNVAKEPNIRMSEAERTAYANKVKAEEAGKLEAYQLKYYECSVNVSNYVGQMKMTLEQIAELTAAGKLTEAEALKAILLTLQFLIEQNEGDAVTYRRMVEVQKMQGAARVAAAQEGRSLDGYIEHPLAQYKLV